MAAVRTARTLRTFLALALLGALVILQGTASGEAAEAPAAQETITVDGSTPGAAYGGVGGVSAGASSRLLHDYPEPERSQVLDYLFKPGYGAALQIMKVEIGSDTNSTAGSEASHMREPGQVDCDRGYEWWLAKEAKKRNPDIKLAGLEWGAPGWFEGKDSQDKFWSQDNIDYIQSWMGCADQHGLDIDYLGGWNERGYDIEWFKKLDAALAKSHPGTEIIGADDCCKDNVWEIADDMQSDPELKKAVDVVGVHFACGHRTEYKKCSSTQAAKDLGKPLWMSENSALGHDTGGPPIARALNRMHTDAGMSGYMAWSPVSAWYGNLPIADTGTILAEWPWSGHYKIGTGVWSFAHTSQFTEVGWRYLKTGSGRLDSGASHVSLASPSGDDFSTVVEAMDVTEPTEVTVDVTGGLPTEQLQLWSTDMKSKDSADHFAHRGALEADDGKVTFTMEPGHVYSLTSTTGQGKGEAAPATGVDEQLDLPFAENFENTPGSSARYFSDVNGAFEATACGAGRTGQCYRQQTGSKPVPWTDSGDMKPTTVAGDPRWWGDYEVAADVMLEEPGSVELGGRISSQKVNEARLGGYHLQFSDNGGWELRSEDEHAGDRTLATGPESIGTGQWHRIALHMKGETLEVRLDGKRVGRVQDARQQVGNFALRTGKWTQAQFDNVEVQRTAQWPEFVPQQELSATATSEHGFYRGYTHEAAKAVDGRPESMWHSKFAPREPLPQAVTVDLGSKRDVGGIAVQPRYESPANATITGYRVAVSSDGKNFREVADGSWPVSWSTKKATWEPEQDVRYVRLVATEGVQDAASAGEIRVMEAPDS